MLPSKVNRQGGMGCSVFTRAKEAALYSAYSCHSLDMFHIVDVEETVIVNDNYCLTVAHRFRF